LVLLDNNKLRKKIAEETRQLIVAPLNLMFAVLRVEYLCQRPIMNHESSGSSRNSENYWRVIGRTLNLLAEGKDGLEKIININNDFKGNDLIKKKNFLCLDNLSCEQTTFPDKVHIGKHLIFPFPITIYRNKEPDEWLTSFWKNHKYILEEDLGLEDIFSKPEKDRKLALEEFNLKEREKTISRNPETGELEVDDDLPY
jgi:hypothetical protein